MDSEEIYNEYEKTFKSLNKKSDERSMDYWEMTKQQSDAVIAQCFDMCQIGKNPMERRENAFKAMEVLCDFIIDVFKNVRNHPDNDDGWPSR